MKLKDFFTSNKGREVISHVYDSDHGERVLYQALVKTIMHNFDQPEHPADTRVSVYFYDSRDVSCTFLDRGTINLGHNIPTGKNVIIISNGHYFLIGVTNYLILCNARADVLYSTAREVICKQTNVHYMVSASQTIATGFKVTVACYEKENKKY